MKYTNFYLIELKDEALSAIFKSSHNLNFFAVASGEFDNDLATINASDESIDSIVHHLKHNVSIVHEFCPELFPHLNKRYQMTRNEDGVYDTNYPNIAKRTAVMNHGRQIMSAKSISGASITEGTLQ